MHYFGRDSGNGHIVFAMSLPKYPMHGVHRELVPKLALKGF